MSGRAKLGFALICSGAASALCYGLLFACEKEILATFTRTDGFYPLLPVLAAFVFSFVHGAFTGYFWEFLGITARPMKKEAAAQELPE